MPLTVAKYSQLTLKKLSINRPAFSPNRRTSKYIVHNRMYLLSTEHREKFQAINNDDE